MSLSHRIMLTPIGRLVLFMAIAVSLTPLAARADEMRPWLCRDKPVFSSDRPMIYEATASKGPRWRITFMQFEPSAGHDGFEIVEWRSLPRAGATLSGRLAAGRYFAVALYNSASGHWVCPGSARERTSGKLGLVSEMCFGESGASCRVTLTVKHENTTAAPPAPAAPR